MVHGEAANHRKTKEYRAWGDMLARCTNPRRVAYPDYGGRGITVCAAWQNSYQTFLHDVGRAPSTRHSLGRIDNNLGYMPGNVAWQTPREQAMNRRDNRILTVHGVSLPLKEWARRTGIHENAIHGRLRRGWTHEQAVTLAVRPRTLKNEPVSVDGILRPALEVCRELGIRPGTFYLRRQRGWTAQEAIRPLRKSLKVVTIDGRQRLSSDVCHELGIHPVTFRRRVRGGLTPQEALTRPKYSRLSV